MCSTGIFYRKKEEKEREKMNSHMNHEKMIFHESPTSSCLLLVMMTMKSMIKRLHIIHIRRWYNCDSLWCIYTFLSPGFREKEKRWMKFIQFPSDIPTPSHPEDTLFKKVSKIPLLSVFTFASESKSSKRRLELVSGRNYLISMNQMNIRREREEENLHITSLIYNRDYF